MGVEGVLADFVTWPRKKRYYCYCCLHVSILLVPVQLLHSLMKYFRPQPRDISQHSRLCSISKIWRAVSTDSRTDPLGKVKNVTTSRLLDCHSPCGVGDGRVRSNAREPATLTPSVPYSGDDCGVESARCCREQLTIASAIRRAYTSIRYFRLYLFPLLVHLPCYLLPCPALLSTTSSPLANRSVRDSELLRLGSPAACVVV